MARLLPLGMQSTRLAICGTPGSGKTSLCTHAGVNTVSVLELARIHSACSEETDEQPIEIDIELLAQALSSAWIEPAACLELIDGHLSHLLPVDAIVVLRCRPSDLVRRLGERDWSVKKIAENVEWELLGGPWPELMDLESHPPCLELDATSHTAEVLWPLIIQWLESGTVHLHGEIDWIAEC